MAISIRYRHTNLVARDWRKLASFYEGAFGCRQIGPKRRLAGPALARGTGVPGAALAGVHLLLPGFGDEGPTLEIFRYDSSEPGSPRCPNREGFGHLAFEVDSVEKWARRVLAHGGALVGEVSSIEVERAGIVHFVYAADPEGNIIELQSWERKGCSA